MFYVKNIILLLIHNINFMLLFVNLICVCVLFPSKNNYWYVLCNCRYNVMRPKWYYPSICDIIAIWWWYCWYMLYLYFVNYTLLQKIFFFYSGIHGLSRLPTPTDAGLGVTTRFILFWKTTAQSNPTIVQAIAPTAVYAGNVLAYPPPQHTN